MSSPLHTVAFTHAFLRQAKEEGVTDDELNELVEVLALTPNVGEMIVGSGGCRKVRLAGRGKGKSGGYRVVTILPRPDGTVYALAVLSKGARENFTAREIAGLAAVAQHFKGGAAATGAR